MKNFWPHFAKASRNKIILALAPMADVTDSAFRHVIAKNSNIPYVTWTEFVSADGLVLAPEAGRNKLLKDLEYSEIERPVVAQFFTSRPENMEKVAKLALELGFDGIDINMGCPDKSIEKQKAGAALIKTPELARALIRAAKQGCENKIPVSVKTRIGYNEDELETWIPELLKEKPAVLTLHLRTRKEMSKVDAHWERMKRAVEIRNEISPETLILGNGDVKSVEDAIEKCGETGCDGVMLGRAIFGNPFLFCKEMPSLQEKLFVLKEHIQLFDKNLGAIKSFAVMKKHFKSYLSSGTKIEKDQDAHGTNELKDKLINSNNAEEAVGIIEEFLL